MAAIDIIIISILVPTFAGVLYALKIFAESNKRMSISIEKLSNSVAYCPLNKKIKDQIKDL